jgi:hypothetical protein
MAETTLTVLRHYVENETPRVEAVGWRHVPGDPNDSDAVALRGGAHVDPGLVAKARPLPAEFDPGLTPNRWVWIGANDPAAKLPRPDETARGSIAKADGSTVDTVEHHHHDDSAYWDYYKLPLRHGVALISEDEYQQRVTIAATREAALKADRDAALEQAKATREGHRASARDKLSKLGLTDDEIAAIVGG